MATGDRKNNTTIWSYFGKYFFLHRSLLLLISPFFLFLHTVGEVTAATFQMQTGYYIGTGSNLSITGLGFQPDIVIVKADTNAGVGAVWKSSAMSSDNTAYFTLTANNTASQITLNADGFTVSSSANVNAVGVRWTWIAFGGSDNSSSGTFCVGSYTGNGGISQSIASVGFQPDLVLVKAETAQSAVWRSSAMGDNVGQYFTNIAQSTNGSVFKTLDSTGFTVGNASQVNTNGLVYQYVSFKSVTGAMSVGSYTGNEVDNRSITGVGFTPDFVFIKNATSALDAVYNHTESYEDYSSLFSDTANAVNHIQLLQSDGFQIGNSSNVNVSNGTIYWAAFGGAVDPTPSGSFKMAMGSYSGNGTSQSITGLNFAPDLVIIKHTDQATDQYAVFRTRLMVSTNATAYLAVATANFASGITSLDSDGFSVGNHTTVNTSGDTYYWEAFGNAFNPLTNSGAANFAIGAYTANEIDGRNISRIGFQPDFVATKRSGANVGTWRTSVLSGDLSSFFGATAESADNIQALNTNGFQLGLADQVSVAGALYWWFAFKSSSNFSVNTYSGTGAAQNITTAGSQPDLVWIKRATAVNGVFRSSSLTGNSTQYFANVANVSDRITGFLSNGFSVGGSQTETNVSGGTYRYAAWKIPSTLTITATDANASESGLDTGIFTITRSSENITSALTVNYTVSGSATSGSDYNSIGSSVTIPSNSTYTTITVTPIDDATDEPPETVIATLGTSSDYITGTPSSATVTIADDDPPAITISSTDSNASEAGPDNGTFTITRTNGDTSSDLTVNYTISGTAVGGSDYNSIGNNVTIAANSTTASVTITPIADGMNESSETAIITLASGIGYTIGAPDSATVNITDNSFIPNVQFTASSQSATEAVGSLTITAQLSAVSGLDVTVPFTVTGTAVGSDDFTITASPVTIAAGSTTATITVTVVDDTSDENDETVIISMGTPTNATAISPTEHTITINDDDLPQPAAVPTPVKETLSISSTSPSDQATSVSPDTTVTATFSMLINGQTPTTDTFTMNGNGVKVPGSVSTEGDTIIFTPSASLDYDTTYTATITKGIQAANYSGTTLDSEYSWRFTTLKFQPPTASTESATNVTSSSAKLNGIVNANGLSTTVWFEYGTTSGAYDSLSSTQSVSGLADKTVSTDISGLSAGTTHYYRVAAKNSAGTTYGEELSFTTTDTTAPNCSIYINDGDSYTNTTSVTLSLSATDDVGVMGYLVSSGSSRPSAEDPKWSSTTSNNNFTASISYTLSGDDGKKTVYAWYKDSAGNISNFSSDSIVLDTTVPTVTINNSSFTVLNNTMCMSMDGTSNDSLGGVSCVTWENNLGGDGTASGTTTWSISDVDLSNGENVITITATDAAGNAGTDTITVTYSAGSPSSPTPDTTPAPDSTPNPSPEETPSPLPSPTPHQEKEGVIFGFVYSVDEEPLQDVEIIIASNGFSNSVHTNEEGYYEFENVTAGNYACTYKKEGYKTRTRDISYSGGDQLELGVIMLDTIEKSSISGYSVDTLYEPIGGVKIRLEGIRQVLKTTTRNTNGFFEFEDLEAGTYKIFARKKGYKRIKKTIFLEEGEGKELGISMKKSKQ